MMRTPGLFRRAFDLVGATLALRGHVLTELTAPTRHWHGLLHHALMLRAVLGTPVGPYERRRLVLAVLFHDIVYDARAPDNEERSAEIARQWLTGEEADEVARLILATKRHNLATDQTTRILLEADLSILWTPSARLYDFYTIGIRREYAHVPDQAYRDGRTAVLSRLVEALRPQLDPVRQARLEHNVRREIADLAR